MSDEMRQVKMLTAIAGEGFSYQNGQEYELPQGLAVAFCTEPPHDPRAEAIGWDPSEFVSKKKPGERRRTATAPDVEQR